MNRNLLMKGGALVLGQRNLDVKSAYTSEVIGSLPYSSSTEIEVALQTAVRLFADRSAWLPLLERVAVLERMAALMEVKFDQLAIQAAGEGGKPLLDSRIEVRRAIESVRLAADAVRQDQGSVVPMGITASSAGRLAITRKEPIGPVVAVSAFNHPLNLIAHQVAPAVATGCPVIVKPSDDTPLSCRSFVEMLHQAGLPPEWAQMVLPQSIEDAERLVTDPRVAFFSFIGSARVGWHLRSKLAPGTRCGLEHGGVAPLIVCDDADLDKAVPSILKGGFYHAGQVCVSIQRVIADKKVAAELSERLAVGAKALIVGDPLNDDTEVGPLIRPREVDRVGEWIDEAVSGGGKLLTGGKAVSAACYEPTIVDNPPVNSRLATAEVFGPALGVFSFDSMEEAFTLANAVDFKFQASIFTSDMERTLAAHKHINASAIMVNDHTAFRVDWMPFAGLGLSGYGVGGIEHTINDMQIDKMLVLNSSQLL
jgi:acyl-CoA reductase-like NAD-dependent aldehyde dehydrogenase